MTKHGEARARAHLYAKLRRQIFDMQCAAPPSARRRAELSLRYGGAVFEREFLCTLEQFLRARSLPHTDAVLGDALLRDDLCAIVRARARAREIAFALGYKTRACNSVCRWPRT